MSKRSGPVLLDLKSFELDAQEREVLAHPQVGGVIFFARNYAEPAQLAELCQQVKRLNPQLVLAVDQEGGRVQRFKRGFTPLPAMARLGELYLEHPLKALALSQDLGWLMAIELRALGIDLSFAPVLDLDLGLSQVIGDRAFGRTADMVTCLAERFIDGIHDAGMKATGKHFPGHGSVAADSHLALPVDDRCLEEIEQLDLMPFKRLASKLDGLMPAHIIFSAVDTLPAGFSRKWLQDIARNQLGFTGVIVSDDLSMAGAAYAGSYSDRALAALEGGCDGVLVCNNPDQAHKLIEELELWGNKPTGKLATLLASRHLPSDPFSSEGLARLNQNPRWQHIQRELAQFH